MFDPARFRGYRTSPRRWHLELPELLACVSDERFRAESFWVTMRKHGSTFFNSTLLSIAKYGQETFSRRELGEIYERTHHSRRKEGDVRTVDSLFRLVIVGLGHQKMAKGDQMHSHGSVKLVAPFRPIGVGGSRLISLCSNNIKYCTHSA